ncbi:hypothetical protein BFP77_06370 [Maribacter sp. 4U21]|uniref:glycosaminoglycan attachment protein n=1 Tax=Maribacter sp. 4U21 TaxID=1889779 RepID=UPI000C145C95|nr:glycosaminoglycan attachment protein [Maribacter sp. 4U21]PIB29289.1 hypothetical protein BFP77_06370 [Maribacter sp. 4U21]
MKDIFKHIVAEDKLHPVFELLCEHLPIEPAKLLIEEIAAEMPDSDGNFIQQFQTTGFHSRLWEIFLFKFFKENGFTFNDAHNRPDFHVAKNGTDFHVEASLSSEVDGDKFTKEYILKAQKDNDLAVQKELIEHYVIPMGSVLYSKLQKKYWELDWVKGKPLVLAITPAHNYLASFLPDAKIIEYLYGLAYEADSTSEGLIPKKVKQVKVHTYGEKEIPANFFSLPYTENISAVIFSNNSDLHKFNRMGYQSGLSDTTIIMERAGLAFDMTPNAHPVEFSQSIIPGDIKEDWNERVSIFHNPNAKIPLEKGLFQNIREAWINEDGDLDGRMPKFFPFSSKTFPVAIGKKASKSNLNPTWLERCLFKILETFPKSTKAIIWMLNKLDKFKSL